MIKGIALIGKKAGMSSEEFHRYWRDDHAPLALKMKTLRRYVQSHRSTHQFPGFESCRYDGAAEIWYDDLETLFSLSSDPDYVNNAQADEPNFIDPDSVSFLATNEKVLIEGSASENNGPLIKAIFLLNRRPDMSVAEFQAYWIDEHAPQIPLDAGIIRYVQCHQAPETYADQPPAYDGVAELSFADFNAFETYWSSDRIQSIFAADAPKFLDVNNCTAFLAEETRVLWD